MQKSLIDETCCIVLQVASLTEELEHSRGGVRDQLKEKDAKINSLVEELGNSQAMLNDKVAELAEVSPMHVESCCCFHKPNNRQQSHKTVLRWGRQT